MLAYFQYFPIHVLIMIGTHKRLSISVLPGGRRRKRDTAESRENIRQTVQQILSDCLASQEPTTPSSTETTTLHPDVANGKQHPVF